jgi:indole-3-glycerol phosphate synthase
MNILDTIIEAKYKEVDALKQLGAKHLEQSVYFTKDTLSLKKRVKENADIHIIPEFKRQSPSKGIINNQALVTDVVKGYSVLGAAAISILTDALFFGGNNKDVLTVREQIPTPILRKEFIIDEIQLLEAKAIGADIILLIAACLTPKKVKALASFAKLLGLEVLLEIHKEAELEHLNELVDFVGVNNRNLKNFAVDLEHSISLCKKIPNQFMKIAESGIATVNDLKALHKEGFDAFLIGELFMKTENPGATFKQFLKECNDAS